MIYIGQIVDKNDESITVLTNIDNDLFEYKYNLNHADIALEVGDSVVVEVNINKIENKPTNRKPLSGPIEF